MRIEMPATKTKPPPPLKRVSHLSMSAVVLAPMTQEEAEQITLFIFPGSQDREVHVRRDWNAIPFNHPIDGTVEGGTTTWTAPPDDYLFFEKEESPMACALLLCDPFQSEEPLPIGEPAREMLDSLLDLAFAEHHEWEATITIPPTALR